jgi:hypothetical protein
MTSLDIATRSIILAWFRLAGPAYACLRIAWLAHAQLGLALNNWQASFVYSMTNKYFLFLFLFLFLCDERTTHRLGNKIKSNQIGY